MTLLAAVASSASAHELDDARAQHQGLDLLLVEHERRQVEARPQHIAHARLALDRHAAGDQVLDVAVDGALRHLQRIAEVAGPRQLLAAHELDDLEQSVGAAHAFHLSTGLAQRDPNLSLLTPRCQECVSLPRGS